VVCLLVVRIPTLDASSVQLGLFAISSWHVQANSVLSYANPSIILINRLRSA